MFELSALKALPHACEFKPNPNLKDGEGVQLTINLEFLTIERIDALNLEIENRVKNLLPVPVPEVAEDKLQTSSKKGKQSKTTETAIEIVPASEPEPTALPSFDSMYFFDKEQIRLRAIMLGGAEGNEDPTQRLIHSWDVVHNKKPVPVCFEVFLGMSKHMQQALYDFVTDEAQKPTKKKSQQSEST